MNNSRPDAETGRRSPTAAVPRHLLFFVPLAWSLFQLWYASPLPFIFNILVLNDTEARAIHLAFAVFLGFLAYPTFKSSARDKVPWHDWLLALVGAFCSAYLYLFYAQLAERPGAPIIYDLVIAIVGLVLLLEATRRVLGPPLMIVALIFLAYTFAGPFMPEVIAHKGASFSKGMSHFWLTTEGVFGIALGVSAGMVFMFVLFGALLESAGAGNYFIRASFALMGHLRGGPAKAAVVSSAMTGIISGSSIANVVTTGTFTIPLMKKVGFPPEKAGAIEVASSTNGQLTPPVMGAAAFLMIEYVGISYLEVIKHALLPALISYIALVYIVHLEACKLGMQGLKRTNPKPLLHSLLSFFATILLLAVMAVLTYYGLGWIKDLAGAYAFAVISVLLLLVYLVLIAFASRVPDLPSDSNLTEIPSLKETAQAGYYFLLPIVVLMWCLTVERFSPALSVFWATVLLLIIVLTQWRLKGWFRQLAGDEFTVRRGALELIDGLVTGASNMISIGIATATAGLIVGTITLTGIGLVMTEFVELVSGGNLLLILIFTAFICLVLGMGLPTTANYIVVSSLLAPVIVSLGAENGLIVPLIAVHLFVFYFGILADDTPPVGLAAFAASGISGGDPIRTGIQGFTYDMRTAILPFMFIFNTELLLIGINSIFHLILIFFSAVVAMLAFAAATQGFFIVRNRWWETLALLAACLVLFRPGLVWDEIFPPNQQVPPDELLQWVAEAETGTPLRVQVTGETLEGDLYEKTIMLTIGNGTNGAEKLLDSGLELRTENNDWFVEHMVFASPAEKAGFDFDQQILGVLVSMERPAKQWMYIPAFLLLFGVYFMQKRRFSDFSAAPSS